MGWGLHSQCLTFFLSGCKGERTESVVGSPPRLLSVRPSVRLWWVSVSREVWWNPKSFPSPSRPPAIFRGPVWFGWSPTRMRDLLIKASKQRACGWRGFGRGTGWMSKMHRLLCRLIISACVFPCRHHPEQAKTVILFPLFRVHSLFFVFVYPGPLPRLDSFSGHDKGGGV